MAITIRVEGLAEVRSKLDANRLAAGPARRMLTRSAIAVQSNARSRAHVDTGRRRADISYDIDAAGFPRHAKIGNNVEYAPYAEEGRGAGGMPPEGAIAGWAARHGIPAEAVFPIRRAIGRRGTKGDHALRDGLNASKPAIAGFVGIMAREIEGAAG